MNCATYADIARPTETSKALAYDVALVLGGSLLLALSARVSFYMGAVPFSAQTLVVLLLGVVLGAGRGSLAIVAYLAEGACGMPVFVGGTAGAAYLVGPTGGYLAGFVVAAALTGFLAQRGWDRSKVSTMFAMVLGLAIIHAMGVAWLSGFIGLGKALYSGSIVFLPGEVIKVALATALLPTIWQMIGAKKA